MEELDLLKKAWQKDSHTYEQISEREIYKMLHKKSSSIVKWILIISIIEVLFWAVISVFCDIDEYLTKLHAEEIMVYFRIANYINYAVILWFIYSFYRNYIKISTTASTKQLMHDIIKTRKTVQYYVWYNLIMILVTLVAGFIIDFTYDPILRHKLEDENNSFSMWITFGFLLLATIIIVGFFWLFYRLLYGILLRKLNANYKELKKIDL